MIDVLQTSDLPCSSHANQLATPVREDISIAMGKMILLLGHHTTGRCIVLCTHVLLIIIQIAHA